jgi:ligand-binding sensor domain-containing protein/class 3 adenylate cyclase/predicted metal-dependent HD superfamily phosphohydrolase
MSKLLSRLLILILICTNITWAQYNYRFRNYTINDGLSQSAVSTILQDNFGALWVGTQDGLNRFDGQTFENLTPENTPGLESGDILCMYKSKKSGILWIGTSNGLTKYDPLTEIFEKINYSSQYAIQIKSITEDQNGEIWVGSSANGIFLLDKKSNKLKRKDLKLPTYKIQFISFLPGNELIISTEDKGLFNYHFEKKQLIPILLKGKKGRFIRVSTIVKHTNDNYLLGTNQGLFTFNSKNHTTQAYLPEFEQNYGILEISGIYVVNPDKLILTSKTNGLFTILISKRGKVSISNTVHDIFNDNALLFNACNNLMRDRNGIFWVGTERGLSSFDPLHRGILGIGPSADLTRGIPSPSVWSFSEDKSSRYLYVGSDRALCRYDNQTGLFNQFFRTAASNSKASNSNVLSSYVVSNNTILLGFSDGFYELKINSDQNYTYNKIVFKDIKNQSNFEKVYQIFKWNDTKFLLATKGGVLLFDKNTFKVKVFEHDEKNIKKTLGGGSCKVIFKDMQGKIWFSTTTGGLYTLEDGKDGLEILPYRYNTSLINIIKDQISSITQTDETTFWLGTMGGGMVKWDIEKKQGKLFNKKNGLPNNVVYGILKEGDFLWLSTNKGLCKFNTNTEKITNFTEQEGLMSNEFNQGAFFKSKKGIFYFGSIYGYNYFDPKNLVLKEKNVDVRFTKIKLDKNWLKPGENKVLPKSIASTNYISLSYRKRSITLKFMPLDLSNPELISYKYVLKGDEEGEVLIGNTNQIHLNSIQPGDYQLKVYAKLGNGNWSKHPATLSINVQTPYWRTIWFWVLIAIGIGLLTVFYFRKKIEYERKQQVKLEKKITERTREIREQNIKIEKQKATIEEKKNHLEEQKQLLEIEKEKTEKVLKNILPVQVYEEIKATGKATARAYSRVSVLFTDFVGFTKISETMKPSDLVSELDIYFRKFDEIIVKNNLEKIKTIGDAYMCAGGVPVRNKTNPIDACLAALQIQDTMQKMREEAIESGRNIWNLRLGINTGEVTAGVIGTEKLAYDIWGSTVNQAQRMEMLGEPGKVTISGQTFKHIEPYFKCVFRGKAKTKGQGLIDMYTVEGIKPELSIDDNGIYPNEKFHQILNLHQYSSINYYKAERHVFKMLEEQLSPKLHYHSVVHTKDVCKSIERIALMEGVTDECLFLLKSAATYHDAGFIEKYDNNEANGARLAEEILPQFGYSEEHIQQIKELIYVTAIPHQPKNNLEEIMCDADLDYLGREDFHKIADKLRIELREYGKINSDRKWDEIQVAFLTNHTYFTKTAKETRDALKAKHLEEIKNRLEKNEYKD